MTREQIRLTLRRLGLEYKRSYNRGWRADQRGTDMEALGEADGRGEPDSWYEGYEDSSAHRQKWHSLRRRAGFRYCRDHHNEPGGCWGRHSLGEA